METPKPAKNYCVGCDRDLADEVCPKCGRTTFEIDDPAVLSLKGDLEKYKSSFLDGHDVRVGSLLVGIPGFLGGILVAASQWNSGGRITLSLFLILLTVLSVFAYAWAAKRIRSRRIRKQALEALPASTDEPIYLESDDETIE